jgi:hypothetical protein
MKVFRIILALFLFVLLATPICAYSITNYAITNSGSTHYTNIPVIIAADNVANAENPSGMDIKMLTSGDAEILSMICDDTIVPVVPSIPESATTILKYTTGNTLATSMPISTGIDGELFIDDSASSDPYVTADGNAIAYHTSFEIQGYLNPAISNDIADSGFNISLTSPNVLNVKIYEGHAWLTSRSGQLDFESQSSLTLYTLTDFPIGDVITEIGLDIRKYLSGEFYPEGTLTINVRDSYTNTVLYELGSISTGDIGNNWGSYSFTTPYTGTGDDVYLTADYDGTHPNWVYIGTSGVDPMRLLSTTQTLTTTISAGVRTVKLNMLFDDNTEATSYTLLVDTVLKDSATEYLPPLNAGSYSIYSNLSVPYLNYVKVSETADSSDWAVQPTLMSWLEPNTMILSDTIPDRSGNSNPGIIYWGENPVDLAVGNAAVVTTELPSNGTGLTVDLNGSIILNDWSTADCSFDFGETTAYGETISSDTLTGDGTFTENVDGLTIGTVYHYRAVATDGENTIYGADLAFTNGKANLPPYIGGGSGSEVLTGVPLMPPQMYTELDTSKIPGGAIVDDILDQSDTPPALWWFPFIFGLIGIVALLVYGLTVKTGGEGSLLIMCVVIESGLILFGIMGVTNTSSIIPLFPMFLFLFPAIAMIFSRKHYSWG